MLKHPEYSFPPEVWVNIFSFINEPDVIFDLEDVCSFFRKELSRKVFAPNISFNRGELQNPYKNLRNFFFFFFILLSPNFLISILY